ncbi:transcriptional repressor of nrd genes [Candidatus Desulfarcum epimagneticum]|uniref:Transcriptional repressor NrdR n=1 Tax=uncultured Desulfobacteraceae bacterium TaxID=218296 RepID=A0A484HQQ6_9BACT|nr:transcriptional repressor of nrd genes [uncultured Desulfobacteraceae bacterium]
MKCPFCSKTDHKVVDSRMTKDRRAIRRRRECVPCGRRFTTYERVEKTPAVILKKDGRRENFSRPKALMGIQKACEKRKISMHVIDDFISVLERDLGEMEEKEIPSSVIGEKIMSWLHDLDDIAYVRFASVYREFKDVNDFVEELKKMLSKENGGKRA